MEGVGVGAAVSEGERTRAEGLRRDGDMGLLMSAHGGGRAADPV